VKTSNPHLVPSEQQRLSLVLNVYYTIDWVRCPAKSLENIRDEMEDVPNAEEETSDAEHAMQSMRSSTTGMKAQTSANAIMY